MAKQQDILSLVTALMETFLLSGTLYGWPSMVEVLTAEGYFADACHTSGNLSFTNITSGKLSISSTTASTLDYAKLNFTQKIPMPRSGEPSPQLEMRCVGQEENFNLAFSVSASALQMSSFVYGVLLDNLGTWVAKIVGISSVSVGLIALAMSTPQTPWLIYFGLPFFVTGGASLNRSNIQVANMFPQFRNSIITLISSAYFASGSIFLIVKIAFKNGIALKTSLYFLLVTTILSWFRTFFLMPRMHFPFPPPSKSTSYGLLAKWKKVKLFVKHTESKKSLAPKNHKDDVSITSSDVEQSSNITVKTTKTTSFKTRSKKLAEVTTNMNSYAKCLKTSIFWTSTFQVVVLEFRTYFYFGTFNAALLRLAGESQLDYYTSVFGIIVIGGSLITPFHGAVVDFVKNKLVSLGENANGAAMRALLVSTLLTNSIALLMSVVASIPAISIQYFVFITVILLRVFSLTNDFLFLTTFYPVEQFGKLLGLHSFIFGIFNFLQAPILKLVLSHYQGDFTVVNVIFVGLCLAIFIHPYFIYRKVKKL